MRTSLRCSAIAAFVYKRALFAADIVRLYTNRDAASAHAGGGPGPARPSRHGRSAQRDRAVQQHTPCHIAVAERDRELVERRLTAVDSLGGEGDRLAVVGPGADEDHLVQRVVEGD